MENKKKNLGQYFTKVSVWLQPQVKNFIKRAVPKQIIDPFAGAGDLLMVAKNMGFKNVKGFDIDPILSWEINDSLTNIPEVKDGLILTNPPYLAKNSAKRQGLVGYDCFLGNKFQDLYQLAIVQALESCRFSVFIIPETFINSGFFKHYIDNITILEDNPFEDTDCPVCICCFDSDRSSFMRNTKPYDIYKGDLFLFNSDEALSRLSVYKPKSVYAIKFNDRKGNLGLRGIDGTSRHDRIRFCKPEHLDYSTNNIKVSSRAITTIRVEVEITNKFINAINYCLEDYRTKTHDVFLSPFKNNNKNGTRRRRMDFKLARDFINKIIEDS